MRLLVVFGVALLGACSEESLAPAPLAEFCDVPGPFRLLPLAPDERPAPEDSIVRVGDRIVLAVGSGETAINTSRGPVLATTTVHALGPCGEDPVIVGHDIAHLSTAPHWPGVVFGCDTATENLLRLDPTGAAPPETLAAGACAGTWTPGGLVHIERSDALRVIFTPYAAPNELRFGPPVVLMDDIPIASHFELPHPLVDGALVLRGGELVHVGLDGGVRVEQPSVRFFALSDDARYLLWQTLASEAPDAELPPGDIFVSDRVARITMHVAHAYMPSRNGNELFPEPDAAQITFGETLAGQWLVELPSLTIRQIPEGRQLYRRIGDGRWLTRSALFGPWLLRDLESGAETPVANRKGIVVGDWSEHLDLLDSSGYVGARATHRLLRFPYDGGEPQVLAPRASRGSYFLPDGRLVSPIGIDDRWLGSLVITAPATREELKIDDHVVAAVDLERWHEAFAPDVIAYAVTDGERSGIWLARPE